jgi:hypothetical protein
MKKNKLDIYLKNLLLSIILNIDKIYSVLGSESKNGINYNCKYEQQLRAHTILIFKMVYNLNILLNEKKNESKYFFFTVPFESRFHIRAQDYYY